MTNAFRARLAAALACSLCASSALADTTAQTLPFSQDWSADQITTDDDWSGVPGITGFRGDNLTGATGADPQTLTAEDSPGVVDVIANQTTPNTNTSGGVAEFNITDRVVAMQGSGTADAPYLQIHLDTTGESDITVSYNVRDIDGGGDNTNMQVALQYRVGATGAFTNIPEAYVADATTGPNLATLVTAVSAQLPDAAENQPLVVLRIMTTNASGSDEWVGIDDIEIAGSGAPPALTLSVADAAMAEGDSGTANLTFTVSLNGTAPAGGVLFDIATSDGSATAGSDYTATEVLDALIPEGESEVSFDVPVQGDTTVEPTETFTVTVTNVESADLGDGVATGTITNDDVAVLAPYEIQGSTGTSAYDGQSVVTRGIVTAIRWNGFNIQSASGDGNPDTSDGIFVYTGDNHAWLTELARGDDVQFTATVDEYTPSSRPHQRSLTELTGPSARTIHSTGNALPAAVSITAGATGVDEFEKYEGMRVALGTLTAVSAVEGAIDEESAVGTSYGRFYGVLAGDERPFREEGLSVLDVTPLPGGVDTPDFDNNPERIRIVNDQEGAPSLALDVGAEVTGIVGVMDYDYAIYSVMPDPDADIEVTGGVVPTAVSDRVAGDVTIAGFNMLHFYDTVDDSGGDAILTEAALAIRLEKAARAMCDYLKTPDIVGVVEVENLDVLEMIATAINDDTFGVCEANPQYVAYLEPGNDVSNINVGFLVSTAEIAVGVPRVEVVDVTQIGKTETFTNPNASTSTLFDRPPLVLEAIVNNIDGSEYPVTVIANHLLSLTSVSSLSSGTNGWSTAGARARAKRGFQAERTAEIVHDRQVANPDEHIVLLGDFNAFEFNDGYVDVMGIVTGLEAAADDVIWYVDSPLATPLTNMTTLVDAEHRYSYSFDGNAQVLDHMVVNQALLDDVPGVRTEHPRINADFGVDHYGDASLPTRISDHDPVLLVIPLTLDETADLAVEVTAAAASADAAATVSFTVDLDNLGPMGAEDVVVTLQSSVATSSFTAAGSGFACTAVDADTVECTADAMAAGSVTFDVDLVAADYLPGSVTLTASVAATSTDDASGNDSDSATTTLTVMPTDVALTRLAPYTYLVLGKSATTSFLVANVSGNDAYSPRLGISVSAAGALVEPTAPAGWTCAKLTDVTISTATWLCAFDGVFAPGRADTISVKVTPPQSMPVTVSAGVLTQNPDPNQTNNRASASYSILRTP